MHTVVAEAESPAYLEETPFPALQSEAVRTGIDAIEADEDDPAPGGLSLYPLIGIALMLASAALVCGGLLYLLKRFGLPHP